MKGEAKSKVVTSGRLTGPGRVSRGNRNLNPKATAVRSEPAYSLYSTDSEDQVNTLHQGLDRCAALLSGILQADKAASTDVPRTEKGGLVKTRLSSSLGKKSIKKAPTKKDQKSSQLGPHGPVSTTPRRQRLTSTAPHSGVKLHPPPKKTSSLPQLHSPSAPSHVVPPPHTSTPPLQPKTSVLLSVQQSSYLLRRLPLKTDQQSVPNGPLAHCKTVCDRGEETVPVRDISVKHGQEDTHATTEKKAKTIHYLPRLKARIAGQGGGAENLLGHLEQIVSPPFMNTSSSNIQTENAADLSSLQSQNSQVHRHVNIVNQQFSETQEVNLEILCNSEGLTLQEELIAAQSKLQELQDEFAKLREAHQNTQSQLRDMEAQNALMKTELEATRSRLLDSEQEKNELASLAQQRLEEIENLNRLLRSQCLSDCPAAAADDSLSKNQHLSQHQHRQDSAVLPTERVTQYLMSLGRKQPPERELPDAKSLQSNEPADASLHQQNSPLHRSHCFNESGQRRPVFNPMLFQSDVESVCSGWSMNTLSTFDTRDETAFRVGLAALDASIASLQKTFQLDLRR
ncbi:uncharacterized protein ccdc14 [Mugil cephalus]|uniref:uncharacterized protein ccdc14 n=1 Tax=Mugil cephalus TaxID=48193 RepID=UPI001FB68A23|nr:uncharacterized protein ccdc14 [Mugil cephalus]